MGFFSNLKKSSSKSRFIKEMSNQVQKGDMSGASTDIYSFYKADPVFSNIISYFDATSNDIEAIMQGLMFLGAGGTYKGHFVPVSAVLFPDTLAYLLRSERGQLSKADAYFQVLDYFQTGALVFEAEKAFH